jgi:hypothetical protein
MRGSIASESRDGADIVSRRQPKYFVSIETDEGRHSADTPIS